MDKFEIRWFKCERERERVREKREEWDIDVVVVVCVDKKEKKKLSRCGEVLIYEYLHVRMKVLFTLFLVLSQMVMLQLGINNT